MSTILVDLGNTRLKWARLGSNGMEELSSLVHRDHDLPTELSRHWGALEKASRILVACVAAVPVREQLESWLAQHWNCQVEFLSSPAQGSGLVNSYDTPARLGIDRWAAMVAARRQAESAFYVVDCGSAVTVDVVDAGGHHLGGLIIPGIHSMLESLGRNTPLALKDIEAVDKIGLGTTTQAAVQSGILGAISCLLNQTLMDPALAPETGLRCFLTGGDAQRIAPLLHIPYEYRAYLVLEGLAILARERA
jgi:type III pantothenate kinase